MKWWQCDYRAWRTTAAINPEGDLILSGWLFWDVPTDDIRAVYREAWNAIMAGASDG